MRVASGPRVLENAELRLNVRSTFGPNLGLTFSASGVSDPWDPREASYFFCSYDFNWNIIY